MNANPEHIKKLLNFVVEETERFLVSINGRKPTADEIEKRGASYEFPRQPGDNPQITHTYFVWDNQHVLRFTTTWRNDETVLSSKVLEPDAWPAQLKKAIENAGKNVSIELKTPDGQTRTIHEHKPVQSEQPPDGEAPPGGSEERPVDPAH